ncbi:MULTISPECIES: carbohydrate ABC transporter permease [unclassified Paenibacillus]|uniref:carbohydrate ABC transporter permease n=1 Tax=unclassified Paenibacillus TaxID=185978 RepID=UPI00096C54FD|nr:carbohydrate ABC transporter permease [Paenibacillus sp. FSL H8-0259]OMF28159.1 ABC transporter permease [Paenibacillus sp. FSL H8-0259]
MGIRFRSGDRLFSVFVYAFLTLFTLMIAFPLLYVVTTSFAPVQDYYTRGFFLFPSKWTLEAYKYLLYNPGFISAFKSSVIITVFGTLINITITSMMAYGLSEHWLKGRSLFNFMILFTMLFSGGLIPTYLVIDGLGLIDTYWALWLPAAIAPFNIIVMRSFFGSLPYELKESARIDGCGEWRLFASIIIPLSKPAIATFTLFYMVGNWNTYFGAIIYLNDNSKWPLQVFLRQMLIINDDKIGQLAEPIYAYTPAARMAAILITAVPLLIIYPFLQKHFNKGMFVGSVKG